MAWTGLPVVTIVRGDQSCATISAAAIVAKVRRDALDARAARAVAALRLVLEQGLWVARAPPIAGPLRTDALAPSYVGAYRVGLDHRGLSRWL
jgi:hypothetical protein